MFFGSLKVYCVTIENRLEDLYRFLELGVLCRHVDVLVDAGVSSGYPGKYYLAFGVRLIN